MSGAGVQTRISALTESLRGRLWRGGFRVSATPLLVHRTPGSVLESLPAPAPRFIAGRPRAATCSGVAWFHGNRLATINLAGNVLHAYRFDPHARALHPSQTLPGPDGGARPENLAFSPDGRWLAIAYCEGAIRVHAVSRASHLVAATPAFTVRSAGDDKAHGASFSRCSRYLALTTADSGAWVRVFRIREDGSRGARAEPVEAFTSERTRLKPKGIDFAPNGRYVAICYGSNARKAPSGGGLRGLLSIHRFHAGRIDRDAVSIVGPELGIRSPEDVKFFPNGTHLAVGSQAENTVAIVSVDAETGGLGGLRTTLREGLSFPHGLGVSPDGRYLAVANYGDDTLAVFAVRGGGPRS